MLSKNKLSLAVLLAAGVTLAGCGGGGSSSSSDDGNTTTPPPSSIPGSGLTLSTCPSFATALNQLTNGTNVCEIKGVFTADQTLTANTLWALRGKVYVGNNGAALTAPVADADKVTLTVEAGTKIVGAEGDVLVISRAGKINAVGTAAAPIIMSSIDDGYDGAGEWGGLVLQGQSTHNECAQPAPASNVCDIVGEGAVGFYGGYNAADSSGTLKYVVVAEAGFEVAPNNELNGITFQAVGSGTTVDYVQVHGNSDDGIEFFGGTVSLKHVVLTGEGDDSIDWDLGWQGNMQHVIVVQADGVGDKGIESDSNGVALAAQPFSMPTISNMTIIGSATDNANGTTTAVHHREATGAKIEKSIMTASTKSCLDIDHAETYNHVGTGNLVYTDVIFWCGAAGANSFADDGDGYTTAFGGAMSGITVTNPQMTGVVPAAAAASLAVASTTTSLVPAHVPANFFDATNYIGAVKPGATGADLWYQGWTVGGML